MFFRLDFMDIIGFFASVVVFARGGELAAAAAPQPAQLLLLTGNNNFSTIGHHRSLQQQSTGEMCLRIEQNYKDVFWTPADPDYVHCECDGETNKSTCTLIFPEVCEEKVCVGNNDNNNNYTKEEGQYRCVDASAASVKPCVVNKFKILGIFDQSGWKETNRVRQNFVTSGVQNIQLYEESYSYNTVNGHPVECGISYDGVACQTCQVCDSVPSSNGNGKLQPEFPWTVDCSNIDDYFVPFTCARKVKLNDDLLILNASVTNELPLDFTVPSSYSSSGRPSSFGTVVFPFVFAAATTTVAMVLPFFGVE